MEHQKLIVINLGGMSAQSVAQAVRDCGVFSLIVPFSGGQEAIENEKPLGIIVTGDCIDVPDERAKKTPWLSSIGIPVLEVGAGTPVSVSALMGGMGKNGLNAFLKSSCGFICDWSVEGYVEEVTDEIKNEIKDERLLLGLSGSVETSVAAALLSKAVGEQLICIYINNGLMRKHEDTELVKAFSDHNMTFCRINAETRFLYKLLGVGDPAKKRRIVEEEYVALFGKEASKHTSTAYFVKGTTYSELSVSNGRFDSSIISRIGFSSGGCDFKGIIEPLKMLLRDEVKAVGRLLNLPESMLSRQPFPSTGLATRCIGVITKERLDILREADAIFREEVENSPAAKNLTQFFAVITDTRSTGIRNGHTTSEYTVALRAVISNDASGAEFAELPFELLRTVSRRITTEVGSVSRVLYDVTDKPPATVEFE